RIFSTSFGGTGNARWRSTMMIGSMRASTGSLPRFRRTAGAGFAHHFFRRLVTPEPEEDRMPQHAIVGPLGESHLRDELRFDPGDFAHFAGRHAGAEARLSRRGQIRERARFDATFH